MSEISKPINPTAEIKEQKITLSETQKETLTDSLFERVRKAIKEIQEKVKIITEKPKLKGLIESKNYAEVFSLIDSYPEDVKKIILKKIYPGIITFSNNNSDESREIDRRNAELFVRNYKYFEESDTEVSMGVKEKNSYRKLLANNPDLLLDNSQMLLTKEDSQGNKSISVEKSITVIDNLLETKNVGCFIRNLDVIFDIEELANKSGDIKYKVLKQIQSIKELILNSDEKIIQDELSNCSNNIKELYTEKLEKRYFKREYIEKAIISVREKKEKAETQEDKDKYQTVEAGLEYLKNFEANVKDHCEKMFEKYGIFEESMRKHVVDKINKFMKEDIGDSNYMIAKLEILAKKEGLEVLEYIAFLQQKLNEMIDQMCFYSYKQKNVINHVFEGKNDSPRFLSQIEIDEKGIKVFKGRASNSRIMKVMEETLFGKDFHSQSRGENNCTYGFINHSEASNSREGDNAYKSEEYGYGKFTLKLKDDVRERTTLFSGDSSQADRIRSGRGQLVTFAEFPHISVLLSTSEFEASIRNIDEIDNLSLDRDFMQRSSIAPFAYFESQYHGKTGSRDQIESVIYHGTDQDELEEIKSLLQNEKGLNSPELVSAAEYATRKK
jgi:hypothetical protein